MLEIILEPTIKRIDDDTRRVLDAKERGVLSDKDLLDWLTMIVKAKQLLQRIEKQLQ